MRSCKKAPILPIFVQDDLEQLYKYAEQEFKLGSGSNSVREQLKSVWRQTGVKPKELDDLVDLPDSMIFVWRYFIDLNNSRTSSGFGINPITYSDIFAYFQLIDYRPQEWEIQAIKRLDYIALEYFRKEQEKSSKVSKSKK